MTEQDKQHPFVSYLERHREDRAMLAALRRGLGKSVGTVPDMYPYVVPFMQDTYLEDQFYLIASLFALHPASTNKGNFGAHLYAYTQAIGDADATTRRFTALLRQSWSSLDVPLRQHVSMLKSKDIAINWHQLLFDLSYWDHDDHFIQRDWASAFWPPSKSTN